MIEIFHSPDTRGLRVIWLCEELELPYRVEAVDFKGPYRGTPEWRRMNPVGKVPVLRDGGLTMFESGAMVQYLLDRHGEGRLQPERGTREHARYLQWCWFAEATFARATGEIANHLREFAAAPIDAVLAELRARARDCLVALDAAVADRSYLLGEDFSAADIMMGYSLLSFDRNVGEELPRSAAAYWARLTARPAFRKAREVDVST